MKGTALCDSSPVASMQSSPVQLGELFRRFFCSNGKLRQWWPKREGANEARPFCRRFFSPVVVLWYLVFQRLSADQSLDAVVKDAHYGGVDGLIKAVSREKINKVLPRLKSCNKSA